MDEYYYAKIAFKAYIDSFADNEAYNYSEWLFLTLEEKQAWKESAKAMTLEVNKYWLNRNKKKKGGN